MFYTILAAVGALTVAAGCALWCLPLGLVVLGCELVGAAYLGQNLADRRAIAILEATRRQR